MVQSVNRDAYREQIHALLPAGRAWPEEADTTLDALVRAMAAQVAEVDRSASNLLTEILPNTTFNLLPEWERVAGLPDICSVLGSTITIRRASLLEKLVTKPTLNVTEFERIGRTFGAVITVEELDQVRADAIVGLDTSGGRWRFVWWIGIPLSADLRYLRMTSRVNERFATFERNTELAATFERNTDGLGDISSLLAVDGTEALSRFQINGSAADSSATNFCALRTLGELNAGFETTRRVQVAGLENAGARCTHGVGGRICLGGAHECRQAYLADAYLALRAFRHRPGRPASATRRTAIPRTV